MDKADYQSLEAYSRGEMSALELRRRLDEATYGDIPRLPSEASLPLPRAPTAGREAQIERARAWMSPRMSRDLKLFVVDTGPLIPLATARP